MKRLAGVALALTLALASRRAGAAPHIVLLEPKAHGLEAWHDAQRAVVSELLASKHELVLRVSSSEDIVALTRELEAAAAEPDALGAVALVRERALGLALVTRADAGLARLQEQAQGAVAEARVALWVADFFRSFAPPTARRRESELTSREVAAPVATSSGPHRNAELWFDASAAWSSDLDAPLPMLGLGAALPVWGGLGAELSVRATPTSLGLVTSAGSLDLLAAQASGYATFTAGNVRRFGVALGLGAGALYVQETAQGAPGYLAHRDQTWVSLVSARARVFVRHRQLVGSLSLEPGVTLPAITVHAGETELLRLGRPWVTASIGLGVAL